MMVGGRKGGSPTDRIDPLDAQIGDHIAKVGSQTLVVGAHLVF